MNERNVKNYTLGLMIALIALVSGISYAYFTASFQNLGTRETSITLAELGSLKLTATEASYSSGDQYPGDIAIQKFEVEPVSKGKGVYEIDLTGVIDETIFGTDVEVSLYKSIDTTEVTVTEGELTQDGSNFSRVDALVTNGLTPVYTGSLKNGLNKLFQEEFEVISESSTLKIRQNSESTAYSKYTFYLVYNYKNNGNQNNQMGQTFSGTISGKIIDKLSNPALDTLESLQELNPNLVVTTSTSNNPNFARIAPQTSAGRGFPDKPVTSTNYVTYGDDVTYDSATGVYSLTNYATCVYSECYNNLVGKYVIPNSYYSIGTQENTPLYQSSSENNNEVDRIDVATSSSVDITVFTGTELNEVKQGTWAPQTSGLFELQDDYGTSYYYRGNVDNNYVKFAGYYWRIIRINGDGSIRMIYAGDASVIDALPNKLEVLANGYDDSSTQYTQIGTSAFNSNSNDNAYVGYMYGTPGSDNYNDTHANTNSSTIKTYLDTWYENNIKNTANEAYIADAIFCNDRSVASADTINYDNTKWHSANPYTTNAFGTNWTMYGTRGRQIEQFDRGQGNKAILTCPNKNDAFTVSDTAKGNGALSYPIGLITSDEVNIAGGVRVILGENYNYYLNTNNWYWTLSPSQYSVYAIVGGVELDGGLGGSNVDRVSSVRPVINLKSDSLMLGSGVVSDPFRVS